jgi:hypothetical protein
MVGVSLGFGLFGTLRARLQKGIEILWELEPVEESLREGLCLYCSALV